MLWFAKLLIRFFSSIDKTLFNFIGTLYELLIDISRTSILSQGDIAEFANRVELMLGIFMLFKITFSLITYIVNPDDFSDKSKGFGKLISRSVISLVMLVLVPYVFQMAYTLQSKVLEDNILPKLILGENIVDNDEEYEEGTSDASKLTIMDTAGQRMAFQVMLPFFSPRYSIGSLTACTNLYDDSHTFSADCKSALQASGMSDKELNNYVYGIENESLGLTFRTNTALAATSEDDDAEFLIDYKYPLSTVAAVVVCLILITFCIDIGLRSVKLAFLQLIYPIPVIGYMDPKAGGNDGIFKKWYKMCLSTFLSLFIRLLALYFGIYIIDKVADFGFYDVTTGAQITNPWVNLFIIIGVLMFVKQLPNILKNIGLNIDGEGSFSLNPLKKIEKDAVGGKILQKPNELLGKAARGIVFAPVNGMSTAGKKFIGGIDAAKNGKGFKQGWDRTHGNLYNAYHKKLDEWAPDSAEARKAERQARESLHQMDRKVMKGEDIYKQVKGESSKLPFSAPYRASYDNVDRAKQEMYKKQAWKTAAVADVEQKMQSGKYSEAEAQTIVSKINKEVGNAEKRYDVAKSKHDEMKKIYRKDALIEDAYDYFDKTASEAQKFFYKDKPETAKDFIEKYSDPNTFSEIMKKDHTVYEKSVISEIEHEYQSMGWVFDKDSNSWSKPK